MEIFEAFQFVAYAVAFWTFVLSPAHRAKCIDGFRAAGTAGRCGMLLEGCVAAVCGLAPLSALTLVMP